tara:strand:+ start:929 stop:1678 length:750 start_codon:yes stop_codon:yes gene_type:complete
MKKVLLVFGSYTDHRQQFFEKYMSPRNREYADKHGFEYLEIKENLYKYRNSYTWLKFTIIEQMIDEGYVTDGDIVTHLDADMCIANIDISYETNKSFSYAIDSGNTHCMGNYSIRINNWSRQMIKNILSDERYEYFKDKVYYHPFVSNYNFWGWFREQASWYSLAGISPHCEESFWNLPNYGWHSDKTEWTEYSLDELHEHVEVLPTAWNVTEMEGESNCQFLINKVNRDDVIIRHFAGGQQWRKEWFN